MIILSGAVHNGRAAVPIPPVYPSLKCNKSNVALFTWPLSSTEPPSVIPVVGLVDILLSNITSSSALGVAAAVQFAAVAQSVSVEPSQ